jgi:hypothetical protein
MGGYGDDLLATLNVTVPGRGSKVEFKEGEGRKRVEEEGPQEGVIYHDPPERLQTRRGCPLADCGYVSGSDKYNQEGAQCICQT